MDYFSIVLGQIIGFVIYILIGIIGVRMGVLTPRSLGVLSQFITKISLPLLLFTNTLNGATREQFIGDLPSWRRRPDVHFIIPALPTVGTHFRAYGQ